MLESAIYKGFISGNFQIIEDRIETFNFLNQTITKLYT